MSLFKTHLVMGLLMLGFVIGAHKYHHDVNTGLEASNRVSRSVNREGSSGCQSINYFLNSPIGQQVSCPFEWIVNRESQRIPEQIVEQVCQQCRSCGPNRKCAQLRVLSQVYYRDTGEFSQQVVRAGCICVSREVGEAAISSGARIRTSSSSFDEHQVGDGDAAQII